MELQLLELEFTVCQLSNTNHVDFSKEFVFLSKTDDEISLVCEADCVPANTIASETGWKALKISGTLDFGMIGVIARISRLLAEQSISVFVISTYNTDYIFIKAVNVRKSIAALVDNGYVIIYK